MNFFKILFVLIFPLLVSSSNLKRRGNQSNEAPNSKQARLSVDEAEISGVIDIASCDNSNQRKRKENPSDEYPKQKVARISADPAESSGVIDAFSGILEPKPNLASHNNSVSLFKTPDELLFLIYSYFKCPYSSLPFVCKAFNESLKKYPLDMHLNSITSMSFAGPLKPSKDLARLLTLNGTYLNERLDQIFEVSFHYHLKFNYPLLASQNVKYILKKVDKQHQNLEINLLASEIMREGYLESFLAIIHQFPGLKLNYLETDFVHKFLKFIRTDNITFIDNLHRLLQAHDDISLFLPHLFSIPNVPYSDFDSIFDSIVRSNPNVSIDFIFQSIGESFSFINFDELTKEEIQTIQERNRQYIEAYYHRRTSEFGPEFAHLCCDMSSLDYEDTLLTDEFLGKMVTFVNNDTDDEDDAQSYAHDYIKILSIIAIKRGFPKLFIQLQTITFGVNEYIYDELTQHEYFQDDELEHFVKDHPNFFASLPYNIFRNLFSASDSLSLLKHKRFALEQVFLIPDLTARTTAEVELVTNPKSLKTLMSNFVGSRIDLLPQLLKNIIYYSGNPARTVNKVFLALKDSEQFESTLDSINTILGTKTYLESLLKPENEDIFEFPVAGIFVIVNDSTFKLFADFAKLMGAKRIAPLLNRLVLDWENIVFTKNLLASDFDSFFKAIGLNIKEHEIIKNKSEEDLEAIESIRKDSRCLFVEPKVDSKYIFEILLQEANLAHQKEVNLHLLPNLNNPLVLSYFGVYDYIMEKNLEAFITYVPDKVFTAFNPKIPYYLLKKALISPKLNETFTERVLLQSFPPETIHRISISSTSDLKVYTTTFYSDLPSCYVDVNIDWEAIINGTVNESEFQIIMENLNQKDFEEKVLTLNPTPKIKEFISIYYQKRDSIPIKQIAQNI